MICFPVWALGIYHLPRILGELSVCELVPRMGIWSGALTHWCQVGSPFWLLFNCKLDFSGYWVTEIQSMSTIFLEQITSIHTAARSSNLACAYGPKHLLICKNIHCFSFTGKPSSWVPNWGDSGRLPIIFLPSFWYHTQHTQADGWLEYSIVTRLNQIGFIMPIYPILLDKELWQIFYFLGKLFGPSRRASWTCLPCTESTRPVRTWNPIRSNSMHLWFLIKECMACVEWG